MSSFELQYLQTLQELVLCGKDSGDRTGIGTRRLFCREITIDEPGLFPILTTKKVFFRGLSEELIWMISGSTNIRPLVQKNVNIWNEWPFEAWRKQNAPGVERYSDHWKGLLGEFVEKVKEDDDFAMQWGDIGPMYGKQMRGGAGSKDQLLYVIDLIKNNPTSRRIAMTFWNADDAEKGVLYNCHGSFLQWFVEDGKLHLKSYQRSADYFMGAPFNLSSYALLNAMIARECNLEPGWIKYEFGDTHLYNNLIPQAKEQLVRNVRQLPRLNFLGAPKKVIDVQMKDFSLQGYNPHPTIKGEIAV